MASDLTVQTIRGPGSGVNANKILIPSGQTLDASSGAINPPAGSVVQVVTMKATTLASQDTTTFSEPSSAYRLSITPKYSNSRIFLTYGFNCNVGGTLSVIYHFRAVRNPGSGGTLLTSDGGSFDGNLGNRTNMNAAIRGPVSDANDSFFMFFQAWDEPASTSQVQYGLHGRRETGGVGQIYYNHTLSNTGSFGWMVPFTITAMEIKQ